MNLNNIAEIKKLDAGNMLGSLQLLSKQVEQVWQTAQKLKILASYKKINKLVVLGMGGSALGAHIIKSVFAKELKVPIEIVNDYNLPAFVDKNTLVIGSSYSGSTEEPLAALQEAKKRKAKIVIISAGGAMAKFAKKYKYPALIFTTENNPCNSPRMGLGYSIVGQLLLLAKIGILKLSSSEIRNVVSVLGNYDKRFGVVALNNIVKQLAEKIIGKSIWYVASEHLLGNAHTTANQMNENGKRFSGYFAIPEMNHHLLEGMLNPKSNKEDLLFVFLESKLYGTRIQKRYQITKNVLDKNNIKHSSYICQEKNKLLQMCEVLVLGSYLSYYSALLNNIDPTPIPFVDYFKKEMGK